jgi:hypothetical protein
MTLELSLVTFSASRLKLVTNNRMAKGRREINSNPYLDGGEGRTEDGSYKTL